MVQYSQEIGSLGIARPHRHGLRRPDAVSRLRQPGLPQAQRVASLFAPVEVAVIGLHCAFEHHDAMGSNALWAFLHEYRIRFPVGVDEPDGVLQQQTMSNHEFKGTPTTVLIDRESRLRRHTLGHISDFQLGAEIMAPLGRRPMAPAIPGGAADSGVCTPDGCM